MRLAQDRLQGQGPDDVRLVRPRLRAAVRGDRREQGAGRPRPAVAAADLELPPRRPVRRSARRRRAAPAARCRSTSTSPAATRRAGFQQIPAAQEAAEVAQIKAAFLALQDPNDWTGDGQPEGWKVIDRVFTKAEARYIPNGDDSTADMAHPTRTGDLVVFSTPPYQFDAATPGTLIARSAFFGQHGYVPDVQDLEDQHQHAGHVPGRRQGDRPRRRPRRPQHRPGADRGVPARHPGAGAEPGRRAARPARGRPQVHADLDRRAERLPRSARPDDEARSTTASPSASAARRSSRRCSTRRRTPCPAGRCCWPPATTSAPRRRTRRCCEDKPTIDVENAWGLDATSFGNHEFDFGVERILKHQDAGELPVPGHQRRRGGHRSGARLDADLEGVPRQRHPGRRHRLGGPQHAGARQPGNTAGLDVPRRGRADRA